MTLDGWRVKLCEMRGGVAGRLKDCCLFLNIRFPMQMGLHPSYMLRAA